MAEASVGLIGMASHAESGGQRAESLVEQAKDALESKGLLVHVAGKIVWDAADALQVADELAEAEPDLLVLVHATWVLDSLQYLLVKGTDTPVALWAVPYTETFSLGCVQHFASVLRQNGLVCHHVYGLPDDEAVVEELWRCARAGKACRLVRRSRVGLIGPRQTWRVAGPQDMTMEEWSLSKALGATIVHVEMDELLSVIEAQSSVRARQVIDEKRSAGALGVVEVDEARLLYAAKTHLAVKALFERYRLTAAAAECYPNYSGLVNLPSSWLADEGYVLDTEGDIGHALVASAMAVLGGGPVALAEIGSLDVTGNALCLAHEGSSAHSLAKSVRDVHIAPGGINGTIVGFPIKPMPAVTLANLSGEAGKYRLFVATGSTLPVSHEEWVASGSKFVARVRPDSDAASLVQMMLDEGVDHHLLLKEGDISKELGVMCRFLGITEVPGAKR